MCFSFSNTVPVLYFTVFQRSKVHTKNMVYTVQCTVYTVSKGLMLCTLHIGLEGREKDTVPCY